MAIRQVLFVLMVATGLACRQSAAPPAAKPAPSRSGSAAGQASGPPAGVAAQPPEGAGQLAQAPAPGTPRPVEPVPARLPEVVARVNGDPVTSAQLEQAVRSLEAGTRQVVPIERRDVVYRQMLDELIGVRLLFQAATAEGLTVTDSEIDARLNQVRQQFPNEQAFLGQLAERRLTVDSLRGQIRTQLLVGKLVAKHIEPGITIGDQEVSGFYEQNRARFLEPEAVRASHILLRADEKADEKTKTAARTQAERLLARARKGEDFAGLAREYSQDPGSAARGGDLGFFSRGRTDPAFEATAFSLKPGELGGVVQTRLGYHVLKVVEHRAARQVPLSEVSDRVRQFLAEQQRQRKTAALVQQLRARASVDVLM